MKRTYGRHAADTIRNHFQILDHPAIKAHLAELDSFAGEEEHTIFAYPGA